MSPLGRMRLINQGLTSARINQSLINSINEIKFDGQVSPNRHAKHHLPNSYQRSISVAQRMETLPDDIDLDDTFMITEVQLPTIQNKQRNHILSRDITRSLQTDNSTLQKMMKKASVAEHLQRFDSKALKIKQTAVTMAKKNKNELESDLMNTLFQEKCKNHANILSQKLNHKFSEKLSQWECINKTKIMIEK